MDLSPNLNWANIIQGQKAEYVKMNKYGVLLTEHELMAYREDNTLDTDCYDLDDMIEQQLDTATVVPVHFVDLQDRLVYVADYLIDVSGHIFKISAEHQGSFLKKNIRKCYTAEQWKHLCAIDNPVAYNEGIVKWDFDTQQVVPDEDGVNLLRGRYAGAISQQVERLKLELPAMMLLSDLSFDDEEKVISMLTYLRNKADIAGLKIINLLRGVTGDMLISEEFLQTFTEATKVLNVMRFMKMFNEDLPKDTDITN